jgi:hypothetical protein
MIPNPSVPLVDCLRTPVQCSNSWRMGMARSGGALRARIARSRVVCQRQQVAFEDLRRSKLYGHGQARPPADYLRTTSHLIRRSRQGVEDRPEGSVSRSHQRCWSTTDRGRTITLLSALLSMERPALDTTALSERSPLSSSTVRAHRVKAESSASGGRFIQAVREHRWGQFDRVARLDVGKATWTVCLRTPGSRGRRHAKTRSFKTTTGSLRVMREWLVEAGVSIAAMESTSVYWKPPF